MKLSAILRSKGATGVQVKTISPDAKLTIVAEMLVQHNIGSLLVCDPNSAEDDPKIVGIITERDLLRAVAQHQGSLDGQYVAETMSVDVISGNIDDDVQTAMSVMTQHRVRHLPVLEGARLAGMVSIGDLVKVQCDRATMENHYLRNYIQS